MRILVEPGALGGPRSPPVGWGPSGPSSTEPPRRSRAAEPTGHPSPASGLHPPPTGSRPPANLLARASLSTLAASGLQVAAKAVALAALGAALVGAPLQAQAQERDPASTPPAAEIVAEPAHLEHPSTTLDLSLPSGFARREALRDRWSEPKGRYDFARATEAGVRIGLGTTVGVALAERMYPGQPDKRLHAIAGGLIAGATSEYVTWRTGNRFVGAAAGCAAALVAGVAKEAYDATGRGNVDRRDVVATAAGGAPVCLSYTIRF